MISLFVVRVFIDVFIKKARLCSILLNPELGVDRGSKILPITVEPLLDFHRTEERAAVVDKLFFCDIADVQKSGLDVRNSF